MTKHLSNVKTVIMKKIARILFNSNPEGTFNIFPTNEKERAYCRTVRHEISKHMKKDLKILEIGSGNGWASLPLIKEGYNIIVSDIQPLRINQININSKKLGIKPTVVLCDAVSLPFPENSFDMVFVISSIHHMEPKKVFKEIKRVLKPEGKLLIIEKNYLNPITWFGDMIFNSIYKTEEKTFTKSQIKKYLNERGFMKVKVKLLKTSKFFLSCPFLYLSYLSEKKDLGNENNI